MVKSYKIYFWRYSTFFCDELYNLYFFHVSVIFSGYRPHSEEIKVSYEGFHPDESNDIHIDYILRKKLSGHKLWDILFLVHYLDSSPPLKVFAVQSCSTASSSGNTRFILMSTIYVSSASAPTNKGNRKKNRYFFSGPALELSDHKKNPEYFLELQKTLFFLLLKPLFPPS